VAGQRLLVSRLAGPWNAVIELGGDAGPELAAELDAPALTVVCRGSVADGAASGLSQGRVLVLGEAGPVFGYRQSGGLALVVGRAGARAGLGQRGGDLVLLGGTGPQAGERQSGGRLFLREDGPGSPAGRGRRGGRFIWLGVTALRDDGTSSEVEADCAALRAAREALRPWWPWDF
jgi:glutamate synthase domain-containing protein 3